jgi:hypothetical protein
MMAACRVERWPSYNLQSPVAVGNRQSAFSVQQSAFSNQRSAFSNQLSAVSGRLSAISS